MLKKFQSLSFQSFQYSKCDENSFLKIVEEWSYGKVISSLVVKPTNDNGLLMG